MNADLGQSPVLTLLVKRPAGVCFVSVIKHKHGDFMWSCANIDGRKDCTATSLWLFETEWCRLGRWSICVPQFLFSDNSKNIILTYSSLYVLVLHGSQIALHCLIPSGNFACRAVWLPRGTNNTVNSPSKTVFGWKWNNDNNDSNNENDDDSLITIIISWWRRRRRVAQWPDTFNPPLSAHCNMTIHSKAQGKAWWANRQTQMLSSRGHLSIPRRMFASSWPWRKWLETPRSKWSWMLLWAVRAVKHDLLEGGRVFFSRWGALIGNYFSGLWCHHRCPVEWGPGDPGWLWCSGAVRQYSTTVCVLGAYRSGTMRTPPLLSWTWLTKCFRWSHRLTKPLIAKPEGSASITVHFLWRTDRYQVIWKELQVYNKDCDIKIYVNEDPTTRHAKLFAKMRTLQKKHGLVMKTSRWWCPMLNIGWRQRKYLWTSAICLSEDA